MESEFVRGSSSVTRLEIHVCYKVRYCHEVFDFVEVKQRCQEIFFEVAALHRIKIVEIGFDRDHVHMDIVIRNTHRMCDVDKAFKGTSGRKLLKEFPEIKRKYFWGSGFWGSQGYGDSVGRDPTVIRNYVKNQGKGRKELSLKNFFQARNTIGL
ncbi:MAG: IS200/IS605 family transposase [Candidatus Aenigmarchaeota archaeon]|nr:IS200/IS605 family transposase [Candidatus Aenigmarchaeota archaeon]